MCGHGNAFRTFVGLAQLVAPELVPQDTTARVAAPPQITCVRCHTTVSANLEGCPRCGATLHAVTCAYCGRRIAAGIDVCPSCGAPARFRPAF